MALSPISAVAGSLIRHGATAGGGAVGAFGVLAEDPLSMGVGAILTVGGFLMSMYKEKTRHDLDLELERHERLGRSEGPQR
jgi:hypothetical protein